MNLFYLPDDRLRPGWRVLLGVLVAIAANWVAAVVASAFMGGGGTIRFELVYRPLTMVLLIAGYSLLLAVTDQVDSHLLAAQGLRRRLWAKHFFSGVAIGGGMIGLAVAVIAGAGDLTLR